MGCSHSKKYFPPILFDAFEKRFLNHQCRPSPGSFLPYWELVYATAFFFRNDEIQSIVENNIQRMRGRLMPTKHDWIAYSSQFIEIMCENGTFAIYGVPEHPVILDYCLEKMN